MNINFCFLTSFICVRLFNMCTFWSYSWDEWVAVHVAFICNYSIVINNLFELWSFGWLVCYQTSSLTSWGWPRNPPKVTDLNTNIAQLTLPLPKLVQNSCHWSQVLKLYTSIWTQNKRFQFVAACLIKCCISMNILLQVNYWHWKSSLLCPCGAIKHVK